ncbi:MAG: hypothetical protein A2X48_04970 [Lentisphaerae bacterium GWF2_49_21]|nr:MAG: hypothetical protein A2X48_04970 [Lentisphaerae bacterium GWF2_49_21]
MKPKESAPDEKIIEKDECDFCGKELEKGKGRFINEEGVFCITCYREKHFMVRALSETKEAI